MRDDIIKLIITSLIGAVIGGLIAYFKQLKEKVKNNIKENKEDETAIREAVKILLRAELKRSCQFYIDNGSISSDEYEELEEEVRVYEALGGNGLIHKLWDSIQELDIT